MNTMEVIRTRRSVRTFDGRALTMEDLGKLADYIESISNPYRIPVEFVFLDTEEYGLSTPVIKGEKMYIAAKAPAVKHAEEAYGYAFEKMVLYAWSLGIGTTWIGGTMKREQFEKAAYVGEGEHMFCISPLGYPAAKMGFREAAMRKGVGADKRKPAKDLFFENDFRTPLDAGNSPVKDALEAVRLAPSAVNKQPWRIVRDGRRYHFYLKHDKGYADGAWDIQKIDMGIALCHFMSMTEGTFLLEDPLYSLDQNIEYIATVEIPDK